VRRSVSTVVIAALPVLVAILRALIGHRAPLGDNGLIALRANDTLTADHPWFGTWTSASLTAGVEFNNPSPLHFQALSVFVKPFGVSAGSVLAAGMLNIAAIAVAVRQGFLAAGRRGEAVMAVAAAGLAWSLGSEMLTDVWQPHSLVLPFLAVLASAWALASGRWTSLAWMVGIGSMVLGAHLSFTYVIIVLTLAAGACCWWLTRAWDLRALAIAGGVGLLAWLQPLLEQFFGFGQGNIGRVLEARGASDEPLGLRLGVRLVAQVVALPPWWGRSSFTDSVPATPYSDDGALRPGGVVSLVFGGLALLVLVGAMVGLAVLAFRREERSAFALLVVALAGVLSALITMMLMPAGVLGLAPHQMRWLWPISMVAMLAVVNGIDRVTNRVQPRHRLMAAAAVFGLITVLNLPAHLSDLGPNASRAENAAVRSLMDQLEKIELPGPAYFDGSTLQFAEPFSGAVLAALTEADQPVRAGDASFARQLGEHRRRRNDEQWSFQVREGADADTMAEGEKLLASAITSDGSTVAVVLIENAVALDAP
jgi:hypothetical protein